ncbi:MAG: DUF2075 domain-containing protein [Eubacteriales bacterium]|nr:DUF2075 domain-containing protein [Eubacteriales bacterium]
MLAYNKTYEYFCRDINCGQIVPQIQAALHRNFSKSEQKAFKNSLSAVKNALSNAQIPQKAQVGLELNVPLTSKRIDFIIAGEDENQQKNIVIVELKQWEKVLHTDMSDIVLLGKEERVHPSWQAFSYGTTITNFNEYVEENPVNIYTCCFLHDYKTEYTDEIKNAVYSEGLAKSPAFISDEWVRFAKFVGEKIRKESDINLLYEISNGKIKPSKFLVDCLSDSLTGNRKVELIDQQRIAFSNIKKEIKSALSTKKRKVIIVKGGAGTGKSLIALHLLGDLHRQGRTAFYVAKSSYIKESYYRMLTRNIPDYKILRTLFRGSGDFHKENFNMDKQFDCLIVDEAHRLTKRTKVSFMYYGNNQIREIIHASKVSVFFIDETQQIDIKDFGTIENIRSAAKEEGAEVIEDEKYVLTSQFRCNGSDEYINWVESILYNKPTYPMTQIMDYDIALFDSVVEMHEAIKKKNSECEYPCRMLSGDVFPWISMNDKSMIDIHIDDFHAQWNKSKYFAVDPNSIDEVGCIHTSQGMEFEYVGLIIGDDLLYRNGRVVTDYTRHPAGSGEFKRPHQRKPKSEDSAIIDRIIRNTYKVLFTRGQKGLYLYVMDEELKDFLRIEITKMKDSQRRLREYAEQIAKLR